MRNVEWKRIRKSECGMRNRKEVGSENAECGMMESLRSVFFKIDRIHSFDVRCWMFDVHQFLFRLDRPFFLAGGGAGT